MKVYKRFGPYVTPYRARFYWGVLAMVGVAAFNGGSILILKPIVDKVFIARDTKMLWLAVLGVPLLMLLKTVLSYTQNYLMSWIGQTVTQAVREDLYRHLHKLPIEFYDHHRTPEILSRVTSDLTVVQAALTSVPLYLIRDSMTVMVLACSLFYLDWRFALVSLAVLPLSFVSLFVLSGKMREASLQSQAMMDRLYERFEESVRGVLVIKAFNYEEGSLEKFLKENQSFFESVMRYLRATALAGPLMELGGSVVVAVIIYFGGKEVIAGHMTPGAFFAFMGAFISAYAPLKNLAKTNSDLQRALASGQRIFQLLDERVSGDAPRPRVVFPGFSRKLSLDKVCFRYPGERDFVLRDLTFEIARGERVALLGPNGAGKTTLIRLLMGLHEPTEGTLSYDSLDTHALDPRSLRASIGLITSETLVFNDTVLGNVTLGRKAARGDVERACAAAGLADLVSALPNGYDTLLGDHGMALPATQRQKLAVARMVLKDPPLVILDDPTATLDTGAEREVTSLLDPLLRGRTAIIAGHRPPVLEFSRTLSLDLGHLVK
jgi:subfamily B ATP-binding cassette protein MsbA